MKRTGRTTRMLMEAIAACAEGKVCYVIVANGQHKLDVLERLGGTVPKGMKVETWGYVDARGGLNPDTLLPLGAHPQSLVFIDHYAIEVRYANILKELDRYNAPTMPVVVAHMPKKARSM